MPDDIVDFRSNEDDYKKLISDIRDNRKGYDDMLESISELRKKSSEILPEPPKDFRAKTKYSKFAMEETMKAISNIFSTELSIRKAKEIGIKTEIELRRKISGEDSDLDDSRSKINDISDALEKMFGDKVPDFDFGEE